MNSCVLSLSEGKLLLLMLFVTMQIYQDTAKQVDYTALLHFKTSLFAVKIPYYLTFAVSESDRAVQFSILNCRNSVVKCFEI